MFVDTGYFQAHSWAEPHGVLSPFPSPLLTAWPRATPAPRRGGQQMGNFGYNQAQLSPSPHPAPNVLPPHIGTSFPAAFPCSFLLPRDLPSATFPWSRQPGALKCPQAGGGHVPGIPSRGGEAARAGVPPGKRVGIALLKHPRCPLAKGGAVGRRVWGLPAPLLPTLLTWSISGQPQPPSPCLATANQRWPGRCPGNPPLP